MNEDSKIHRSVEPVSRSTVLPAPRINRKVALWVVGAVLWIGLPCFALMFLYHAISKHWI